MRDSKNILYSKLGVNTDPLEVMRKLGLNVPSQSDISTSIKSIVESFSRGSDAKEMTTGSEEFSKGNYLSGGAKMLGGLAGMAVPFSGKIRSAGKAVGKNIDDIIEKKLAPKESEFFEEMINAKGKKKLQQKDGTFKDGEEYGDLYDLKYDVPSINIVRNKDGNKILSMNKKDMDNFFKWSENFPDKKSLPIAIKSDKFFNRFKPSGKELKEEGGSLLPLIKREAGGGGFQDEAEAAAAYDDYTSTYGYGTGADLGNAGGSNDGTYNLSQLEALNKADDPSKGNANTDDYGPGGLFDLGYNPQELKDIRAARQAAYRQDALDKQNEGNGDIPYLSGNTRYDTTRSQYAQGPLTSQQINENLIYNLLDRSKAQKDYEKRKGDWLTTLVRTGRATPQEKAELETLKSSTYKANPEDFKAGDKGREEREEALNDVDRAAGYLKGGFAPLQTGGQVLEGLDREYMRQRNSKEKVEGMMGILPIQPRQYGGGLDDAYMNRRSAFAAPDANSAFASPMGRGDLPTMYRQEGGDIPITSVNGQGIRRIIYRESGGGLPTIYRANGGDFDFMDSYDQADIDAAVAASDADEAAANSNAGGSDYGPDVTAVDAAQQAKDDAMYLGYQDAYSGQYNAGYGAGDTGGMSQDGQTVLLSQLRKREGSWPAAYDALNTMSPEMIANFDKTVGGKASLDGSTGYRFGGPGGTLQDILEKAGENPESGLQSLMKKRLKKGEEKEEKKEENIIDTIGARPIADLIQKGLSKLGFGGKELTDGDKSAMENFASSRGDQYTPRSGIDSMIGTGLSFALPGPLGMLPQSIGVYKTKSGLEFNVGKDFSLTLNTPTPTIDYGNDVEKPSKSTKKKKKDTEKEKQKRAMDDYFAGITDTGDTKKIKNYYETLALKQAYPEKSDEELNIMINQP